MKANTRIWLNISVALVLLIGIGLLVYFLPCPSSSQYIFFKVVLALAAAAFSAILLGFIHLNTSFQQTTVKATGGFAIFLLVLKFTPDVIDTASKCAPVRDFTFIIRNVNKASIPDLKGKISLLIGNDIREADIDKKGTAYFRDLSNAFLEEKVTVELKTDGWWLDKTRDVAFDTTLSGGKMMLLVSQDESLCCVEGKIMDSDNITRPIAGATIQMTDTTVISDARGRFSVYVHHSKRKPKHAAIITAEGYLPYTTEIPPNSDDPYPIYLQKKQQ